MKHDSKEEAMYVRAAERAMDLAADGYAPVSEADEKRANEIWEQYEKGLINVWD